MIGTGSSLERILACPPSSILPQDEGVKSEYASTGTAGHNFLEAVHHVGVEAALEHVPDEYREMCELIPVEKLPTHLSTEVAFAYDAATGEATQLGRLEEHRNYGPLPSTAIACTVDVCGVSEDSVYIADWKFGHGSVTKARENPQLLFGALCAARVYGKDKAIVEIIKLSDPGRPWHDRDVLDAFDLGAFQGRVIHLRHRIEKLQNRELKSEDFAEGEHCKYCKAFDSCPKKQALIKRASSEDMATEVEMTWVGNLTPQSAPDAYRQWRMVKQLEKRMANIIHAYAKEQPIHLGEGKVFGARTRMGNEKIDGDAAWRLIEDLYGGDVADDAVARSATKASIRRALKKWGPGLDESKKESLAAREKAVLEELRAHGGTARKETTRVEEYEEE